MDKVTLIDDSIDIGIRFRNKTEGPELNLVYEYIDNISNNFKHRTNNLAIFIEPLVDTTYPDIVLLEYSPKSIDLWNDTRNKLEKNDIKLLSIIKQFESISSVSLHKRTNITHKNLLFSLENLLDSGLIDRKKEKWTIKSMKEIFYVKKIISVEAKINQLDNLLHQADINNWFSSESYALSSVKNPQKKTLDKFIDYGIGLHSLQDKKVLELTKAKKQSIPNNYITWMFNEWIGRYISQR